METLAPLSGDRRVDSMIDDEASTADAGRFARVYASVERPLDWCEKRATQLASGAVFLLMILGVVQIGGRKILNTPVAGYIDIVEQLAAVYAFFGAAYCQRLGEHVRMDLLLRKLKGRTLWVAEAFTTALALFVIGLLACMSFEHFLRAYHLGDTTMDIELSLWPAKLVVPLALGIWWIRLFLQFAGFLRLAITPTAEPMGIPKIAKIEELAADEIRDAGVGK